MQFTEDQKKVIEKLVEGGKTAEAQKIILAELERQVGGSAEAYGTSLAGKVDKARNTLENFREELASKVIVFVSDTAIPAIQTFARAFSDTNREVNTTKTSIEGFVDFLGRNIGDFEDFKAGLRDLRLGFGAIGDAWDSSVEKFRRGHRDFMKVIDTIRGPVGRFIEGISGTTPGRNINFRAAGGPVAAGKPYVVGERGPELMYPRSAGTIVPNHALGGDTISIVINGPVSQDTLPTLERRLVGALRAGRRS